MKENDRRSVLTGIISSVTIATVGLTVIPKAAKSLPLGAVKAGAVGPAGLVAEARVLFTCIIAIAIATGAAGGTGDAACALAIATSLHHTLSLPPT
jgi:hypothetical protein